MERRYDILEVLPDGTRRWRASVSGHLAALERMKKLSANSPNEFIVMDVRTRAIITLWPTKKSEAPEV